MKRKYLLSDRDVNNLLVFLDRVKFEGFKEVQIIQELVNTFKNPVIEEGNK